MLLAVFIVVLTINILVLLAVYGKISGDIARLDELVQYLEVHNYK